MKKYFLLTLSLLVQVFCLQADTFTVRPAEQKDMPACIQLAKQVCSTTYRPFLTVNGFYGDELVDEYVRKIDTSFFEDIPGSGKLFVAETDKKEVVACMKVNPFFAADKKSKVWKQFITIKVPEADNDIHDGVWYMKYCDGSGAYVSRLYVDQNWRGKGIGKLLLKSVTNFFPLARTICLSTYAGNKPAFDFYKHLGFVELARVYRNQPCESVFFSIDISLLT